MANQVKQLTVPTPSSADPNATTTYDIAAAYDGDGKAISSTYQTKNGVFKGDIDGHPENTGALYAYYANDLIACPSRGAEVTITNLTSSKTATSSLAAIFDGTPSYYYFPSQFIAATTDQIRIDVDFSALDGASDFVFTYSNQIGIGFGAATWRAKSITLWTGRKSGGKIYWVQKGKKTGNTDGVVNWKGIGGPNASATATADDGTTLVGTSRSEMSAIRFLLTDFNTTTPRIGQIWVVNFNSKGLANNFLQRTGGTLLGNVYPTKIGICLGSKSHPFATIYGDLDGKAQTASAAYDSEIVVCDTAAKEQVKQVTIYSPEERQEKHGAHFRIRFANSSTYEGQTKLRVWAKDWPIYIDGEPSSAENAPQAGFVYSAFFSKNPTGGGLWYLDSKFQSADSRYAETAGMAYEDENGKNIDETYLKKAGDEMTGPLVVRNGNASGCLVLGAGVNKSTLIKGDRKLARVAMPTYEDPDFHSAILSADSISAGYNVVEFGGHIGDVTNTSPDLLGFVVATEHNGTENAKKTMPLFINKGCVGFFTGATDLGNGSVTPDTKKGKWQFFDSNQFQNEAYTYTLPSANGTLALKSDLEYYEPKDKANQQHDNLLKAIQGKVGFSAEVIEDPVDLEKRLAEGKFESNTIYLVRHDAHSDENDTCDEYILVGDKLEKIGNTDVNLSNYVKITTDQTISGKKTFSGGLEGTTINATTAFTSADDAYFQSRHFRGEGDTDSYYHAMEPGYAGHNSWDWHEYGGLYSFWKNTAGTADGGTKIFSINDGNLEMSGKQITANQVAFTFPTTTGTIATQEWVEGKEYLKTNGTNGMTGPLSTDFEKAVAVGSLEAQTHTIPDLIGELSKSHGAMGSVNLTEHFVFEKTRTEIQEGWYNFLYIPHRNGAGFAEDNALYGTLLLFGMTKDCDTYRIRYTNGAIASVNNGPFVSTDVNIDY